MKRILISVLMAALLMVSCGDKAEPAESESVTETQAVTDLTLSGKIALTGENLLLCVEGHESIAVEGFRKMRDLWLFLPAGVDAEKVRLTVLNENGAQGESMTVNLRESVISLTLSDGTELAVEWQQSSLPGVFICLDEGDEVFAAVEASEKKLVEAEGRLTVSDLQIENAKMTLGGRGNWTWIQDKKGYSLKFSAKTSILGMAEAKSWVLLANKADTALMRNMVAYDLAKQLGMPYTPDCIPCELYVNGEYRGSYQIAEKTEIGKNRIDIADMEKETEVISGSDIGQTGRETLDCGANIRYAKNVLSPSDVSGGYLLEFELADRYSAEPCGFQTKRGFYFVIKSPEYASREQVVYIAELYQKIENALFKNDPALWEMLDMESAVKKYLLEEIIKNFDANHSSQYFHKDAGDSLVCFGPMWDLDAAFGNTEATVDPNGRYAALNGWWKALRAREDFTAEAKRVWEETLRPICMKMIEEGIPAYEEALASSAAMNFIRWDHLGVKPPLSTYIPTGNTYAESVEQLRSYFKARIEWMDGFVDRY
ncbi:MAG: CotH kinase family protein [Clostridia bacterium]|nr:CotH kinase family protein [Clostridia bacterium]